MYVHMPYINARRMFIFRGMFRFFVPKSLKPKPSSYIITLAVAHVLRFTAAHKETSPEAVHPRL